MSILVDNLVAYRVLSMLVKNFEDTKAFKLGIIDAKGKNLKKPSTLKTQEEKEAYNYLNRLVFNMKKIINRLPGGESKLKSLTAAYFLVKEYYERNDRTTSLMEENYIKLLEQLNLNLYLVEEELFIKQWIEENQITELTTDLLARYKTAASASAKASDEAGNYKKGDKRFSGINKATKKQFDNDLKKHGQMKENNSHYEDAQEHLALASKALETSDMVSHHAHLADHHGSLSQWHDSKGRSFHAQKHADKSEYHSNKFTQLARGVKEEMAANATGPAVATDTPAPLKKDIKKYKNIARRKPLVPGV